MDPILAAQDTDFIPSQAPGGIGRPHTAGQPEYALAIPNDGGRPRPPLRFVLVGFEDDVVVLKLLRDASEETFDFRNGPCRAGIPAKANPRPAE